MKLHWSTRQTVFCEVVFVCVFPLTKCNIVSWTFVCKFLRCMAARLPGIFGWFGPIHGTPDPHLLEVWHCIQCMEYQRNNWIVVLLLTKPTRFQLLIIYFIKEKNPGKIRRRDCLPVVVVVNRICCQLKASEIHHGLWHVIFASGIYWFQQNYCNRLAKIRAENLHRIAYIVLALPRIPLVQLCQELKQTFTH